MFNAFAASNVTIAAHRVSSTWTWYVVRGGGLAAAGLLILLMISGIGHVTGLTYRFFEPIKAWAIHRALAIALCFAIGVHIGGLLLDRYTRFSLAQVFVPFAAHYARDQHVPVPTLWVTFGVLAMYSIAVVVATSLGWMNSRKKTWKLLHYLNYLVIVLIFLHALFVGSDLAYGAFRAAWLGVGGVLALAIATRLRRAGTMRRKD